MIHIKILKLPTSTEKMRLYRKIQFLGYVAMLCSFKFRLVSNELPFFFFHCIFRCLDVKNGLGHQKNIHFFVISAVLREKNSSVSCRINVKKCSKIFCVKWIITFSCQLIVRYVLQLTSNFHKDSSKGVFCLAPRR